ncbi:MAG: exodeoxyribonuclease VII small subunit [Gammaproteobacteria bacterium]|nr:exodeoxyribonuclease VII small subunit [Gammaproteobacteria bacterium]
MSDEPVDFEAALAELEELVSRMEGGTLSLEASLEAFERGIKLTRDCQAALRQAELRVKALTQDGDEVDLTPPREDAP